MTKTNSYRLETFRSNELGCLGYADSDEQVVFYRTPTRSHTLDTEFQVPEGTELPRVDIAYAYAGADGLVIRALADAGVPGLVAAGLGSGGSSPEFMAALKEARQREPKLLLPLRQAMDGLCAPDGFRRKVTLWRIISPPRRLEFYSCWPLPGPMTHWKSSG